METMDIVTINFLAVLAMMLLGWGVSLFTKNVTHVDSLWGLGFVLIAWMTFALAEGFVGRRILISLLVSKQFFGLVTLALDLINNFVDIISYVRLYAVGAASLAIAVAFNEMATGIGFSGLASIGAAFILFLGHPTYSLT